MTTGSATQPAENGTVNIVMVRRIVWSLVVLVGALIAAQLALMAVTAGSASANYFGYRGAEATAGFVFTTIGALIVPRQPRNPVGWLLLLSGVGHAIVGFGEEYGVYALFYRNGEVFGGYAAAWIAEWLWLPALGGGVIIAFLRFPDGRLISPRWIIAQRAAIAATLFATFGWAFVSDEFDVFKGVHNPLTLGFSEPVRETILAAGLAAFAACMLLAVVSLWVRLRRSSTGIERQQLKWVIYAQAFAFVIIGLTWAIAIAGDDYNTFLSVLSVFAVFSVPASIGVAMLRHGLYEIDVIINRTFVYVPLSALLAGVYIGGVGVLRTVFTDALGLNSDAAVAIMAVVVVTLTTPVRNKFQSFVDRHFKDLVSPVKAIDQFSESVDRVLEVFNHDRVARRFVEESARAFEASSARLSLHRDGTSNIVHEVGEPGAGPVLRIPVQSNGQLLGELELGARTGNRRYSNAEIEALRRAADMVAQALGQHYAHAPVPAASPSA